MQQIIKNDRIINDPWRILDSDTASAPDISTYQNVIYPCNFWLANKSAILAQQQPFGIWLPNDMELKEIAEDLDKFSVIAIHYPKFTDGRGHSLAALLRQRYHYKNELRAFGDVLRDQLFYLKRCGFDAFSMRKDQDLQSSISAFNDFSETYQFSTDDRQTVFRKRHY